MTEMFNANIVNILIHNKHEFFDFFDFSASEYEKVTGGNQVEDSGEDNQDSGCEQEVETYYAINFQQIITTDKLAGLGKLGIKKFQPYNIESLFNVKRELVEQFRMQQEQLLEECTAAEQRDIYYSYIDFSRANHKLRVNKYLGNKKDEQGFCE